MHPATIDRRARAPHLASGLVGNSSNLLRCHS
jgi:hypothetical protein